MAALTIASSPAFSQNVNREMLNCTDFKESSVQVFLNSNLALNRKEPTGASLFHNFSMVNKMTCTGGVQDELYNLKCAGYYNLQDEFTEFSVRNVVDKIIAFWTTSIDYGSLKKQTQCELKQIN